MSFHYRSKLIIILLLLGGIHSSAWAEEKAWGDTLGDLFSGLFGSNSHAPPPPQSPPPAAMPRIAEKTQQFNALLVKSQDGKIILYPFENNSFKSGKVVGQQWELQDALSGDWNYDGATDLLLSSGLGQRRFYWQINRNFQEGISLGQEGESFIHCFKGDFDGDRLADLIARRENGDLYLYTSKSNQIALKNGKQVGKEWFFTHYWVKDWNNDGISDFLVRTTEGGLILYPFTQETFTAGVKIGKDWNFTHYFAEDWNNDGTPDLAVRTQEGEVIFYPFQAGRFQSGALAAQNWQFTHYFPGDWNGDGKAYMLTRSQNGEIYLHNFQDGRFQKPLKIGQDWHFQSYLAFNLQP